MEPKILVGHASKYGATADIAEKIGERLRQSGFDVDVLPAKNIKSPEHYDAFIIGGALYSGYCRADALNFLLRNKELLERKYVNLFFSGPLSKGNPFEQVKEQFFWKMVQPIDKRIKIHEFAIFHGALDMSKLNFFERQMFKKMPEQIGDFRDWNAITGWADKIAAELKQ
jgi:menaquinone-dependent protoporphyrinogen oxidase